jgi:hypothetical protein
MSGAVQSETIRCVAHSVNRFTIEIATTPQEFRRRAARAVAGDRAFCVSYLMGNHTIAERMYPFRMPC